MEKARLFTKRKQTEKRYIYIEVKMIDLLIYKALLKFKIVHSIVS